MMEIDKRDIRWKLWIQWVLAYSISFAIGLRIATRLPHAMGGGPIEDLLYSILGVLLFGLIVGVAQWIVLSRYGISKWWIPVTMISILFLGTIDGSLLFVSIPQSLVLWRRVRWAGLWIVAHIPAFIYLMEFNNKVYEALPRSWLIINRTYISYIISGVIAAVFSGYALVWLLRHPKQKNT